MAAQHPNASGQFIHYASPRLRREAKSDTQQLVNKFNIVINGLISARCKDALELGKALAQANQTIQDTQAEADAASPALGLQTRELEEKDALIARYKSMLGLAPAEGAEGLG